MPQQSVPQTVPLTIGAASSLAPFLPRWIDAYTRQGGSAKRVTIRTSFGASGTLAQQIRSGAPIDILLSAGEKEVDDLVRSGDILPASRTIFAGNQLVLAQAKDTRTRLRGWADLLSVAAGFRLALGKPETVPAGRYARQTLEHRQLWAPLTAKRALVFTGTVRQAADAAASGNVDAALIFATDVRADPRLQIVDRAIPAKDHTPIRYVAATVQRSIHPMEAGEFIAFLRSKSVQSLLRAEGFVV